MNLSQITLADFLCDSNCTLTCDVLNQFDGFKAEFSGLIGAQIRLLGEGYVLHRVLNSETDILLLCGNDLVGVYSAEVLAIADEHQNKGLSTPLILAAVENRPLPEKRTLTPKGKRALTRAWQVANGIKTSPW